MVETGRFRNLTLPPRDLWPRGITLLFRWEHSRATVPVPMFRHVGWFQSVGVTFITLDGPRLTLRIGGESIIINQRAIVTRAPFLAENRPIPKITYVNMNSHCTDSHAPSSERLC